MNNEQEFLRAEVALNTFILIAGVLVMLLNVFLTMQLRRQHKEQQKNRICDPAGGSEITIVGRGPGAGTAGGGGVFYASGGSGGAGGNSGQPGQPGSASLHFKGDGCTDNAS